MTTRRATDPCLKAIAFGLVLGFAVVTSACSDAVGTGTPTPPSMVVVAEVELSGQSAYSEARYEDAARIYIAGATAIEETKDEHVQAWRDRALYNAACSQARLGQVDAAAATFARSVEHGLRTAKSWVPGQGWRDVGALALEHVLADPDLDAIRPTDAYRDALSPFLAAGALNVDLSLAVPGGIQPALLLLDQPERAGAAPWELDVPETGLIFATLPAPIARLGEDTAPADRRWLLTDGDERWALARVREAQSDLESEPACDPAAIFVVGVGPESGTAALHALLIMPDLFAGVVVFGARVHPAAIADDVAVLARRKTKLPRIAFGPAKQ